MYGFPGAGYGGGGWWVVRILLVGGVRWILLMYFGESPLSSKGKNSPFVSDWQGTVITFGYF